MDHQDVEAAAGLLLAARKTGNKLQELPERLKPRSIADVRAIQDAADRQIPEPIVGYKFHKKPNQPLCYAPLYPSRLFESPARIRVELARSLFIEAEITFKLVRDLPARPEPYDEAEVMKAFVATAAFEVVDSRFVDLKKMATSALLEVYADHMANGGFVLGAFRDDWRSFDFTKTHVTMRQGDRAIADQVGGHPNGDPGRELPAFVNAMREGPGLKAGAIVATGSFTSFRPMVANQPVIAEFAGFGAVTATVVA
jgi:2-keto-4-pentenoate hydratase